jgi:Amt family ammonium transporter
MYTLLDRWPPELGSPQTAAVAIAAAIGMAGLALYFLVLWRLRASQLATTDRAFMRLRLDVETTAARYQSILETAADAIIIFDRNGTIELVNSSAEEMFGYAHREMLGANLGQLLPTPQRERHAAYLHSMDQRNPALPGPSAEPPVPPSSSLPPTVSDAECDLPVHGLRRDGRALRQDGTEFPVEVSVNQVHLENQPFFTAIIRDVTQRREAEQALKDSERRAVILQEITAVAHRACSEKEILQTLLRVVCQHAGWSVGHVYVTTPDGKTLVSSRVWHWSDEGRSWAFRQITEQLPLQADASLASRVLAGALPQSAATLHAALHKSRRQPAEEAGLQTGYAFPIHVQQQVAFVVEFFAKGDQTPDAALTELMARAADVVGQAIDRRRVSGALRESEQFLRKLLEYSPTPMLVETFEHRLVLVNHRLSELFGYRSEDLQDIHVWWRLAFPDELYRTQIVREWFHRVQQAAFNGPDEEPMMADVTCRDGTVRHVEFRFANIGDRYLVVMNDLTDRIQAEQAIRSAKEQAEFANRAKSQFLATISHELRTPLNGVIGMADLLKTTRLDERQQQYVNVCHSSAKSLLGLINHILDFSKIEAGRLELNHQEFQVDELIEEAVDVLAARAHEKRLELVCDLGPGAAYRVKGDGARVRQVLINFLGNAIKFTDRGEVVLRVFCEPEGEDRLAVLFTVTDTGIGIPAEELDRLFTPFTQLDGSATRRYGGTGLGLAISKRLIEALGGHIGVESRVGRGSQFWFWLPLEILPSATVASMQPPAALASQRCLVVEPSVTNRQVLVDGLRTWGLVADGVADVEQACAAIPQAEAEGARYAVVLASGSPSAADIPAMTSILSRHSHLPLVLLTPLDALLDKADCQRLGVFRCITKPVKRRELLEAVLAAVSHAVGWVSDPSCSHPFPSHPSRNHADARQSIGSHPPAPAAENPPHAILVAEDNDVNRLYIAEALRVSGYACDLVPDGLQAVAAATERSYDLILMDCHMPGLDGLQATGRIRELESRLSNGRRSTIIALTANATEHDRQRCLLAGMDEFLSKPVDFDALKSTVERHLRQSASTHAVQAAPTEPAVEESPAPAGDPPIDFPSLVNRCMGNLEFVESILGTFLSRGSEEMVRLAQHFDQGDCPSLAERAHSLKGAAGIISATRVQELARQLEHQSRRGDLQDCQTLIERLRGELEHCTRSVQRWRERETSQPESRGEPVPPLST